MVPDEYRRSDRPQRQYRSDKEPRIDGTAALLDCYVGLYEHYNEYTTA